MAKTLLYTHPVCVDHDPGARHPESGARLEAIQEALAAEDFENLERREAPLGDSEMLGWAHDEALVEAILANVPAEGRVAVDADTVMSPASGEAARRAAGAVAAAVDAVLGGEADNAFCAVRPPGHHAEPRRPMGFCLFNNVVVGAERARRSHGLTRIGVVDFDVHHGNGTPAAFAQDGDLFFGSTHQSPLYPGTGAAGETGVGNIVNAPLSPGTGSAGFRDAMESRLLPALRAFRPEMILISAGFDAHRDDPLAQLELVEADYAWITEQLCRLAGELCEGRVVSTLEGGYDLRALAASAATHVESLMAAG